MARWDYQYLGVEAFPETLSALEIGHFFTWSPLNSPRCGADAVL
jgi:hypothetical protein